MENRTTESAIWVEQSRLSEHSQQELLEADVVAMVKELTNGILGFNNEEFKEILTYVMTS